MPVIKGIVRDEAGAPFNGALVRAHQLDTGAVLGESTSAATAFGDATFATTTKILLPFDTDFTDLSPVGTVWTAADGAFIGTANKVFGAGALDCSVVDARVAAGASAELRLIGQFSVQARVFFPVLSDTTFMVCNSDSLFFALDLSTIDNKVRARAVGVSVKTDAAVTAGVWYDIEVSRDAAGEVRFFLGGAQQAAYITGTSSTTDMVSNASWMIGAQPFWAGSGNGGRVLIDNFRLKVGEAVHTAAFTPDTAPFATTGGSADGVYEITTAYTGEAYAVGMAPSGGANPSRNHSVIRVVPG